MDTPFQDFQKTFHDLHIPTKIIDILDRLGFSYPSFIQAKTIPLAIEGKDIVGIAQTGTGKTLAFGIPMMARLAHTQGRGLVLAPTRELAAQIHEDFKKIGLPLGIHTVCIIGGEDMRKQIRELHSNVRVIIATPGRMLDHLRQQTTRLDDAIIVVLDEADRMLDMGFMPQVEIILKHVAQKRQTLLFSATIPEDVIKIAHQYMHHPTRIEITPTATAAKNIHQSLYIVSHANKFSLLEKLLHDHKVSTLIFCRTKIGAARLARNLKLKNIKTAEIHSDKNQQQRKHALESFKKSHIRVLVATEIAARGIDVKDIGLVLNYDLPDDADNYVHRIGRTGRAGRRGLAVSFACPDQSDSIKDIEKAIQTKIPIEYHPAMPKEYFTHAKKLVKEKSRHFQRRRHR
ncbi:MAG: DEAD/DEAH box helicase [Candidatus Omnitrophica bacterium]|nr:DEAD/DEAH box helicase [Candidatus Omnitrophota bacterium]